MFTQTTAATRIAAVWRGYQIRKIISNANLIENWSQYEYLWYTSCYTYIPGKKIAYAAALRLTENHLNTMLLHRPYNRRSCVSCCHACALGIARPPLEEEYDSEESDKDMRDYYYRD